MTETKFSGTQELSIQIHSITGVECTSAFFKRKRHYSNKSSGATEPSARAYDCEADSC